MTWKPLGAVAPTELTEARLQLHHAAQVVASAGVTSLEPQPDDSHPNLGWVESLGALVGRSLPGAGVRVGLRVADLSLVLVEGGGSGRVAADLSLDRATLEDGYEWLLKVTTQAGVELPSTGLRRAAYEIPPHPTGAGVRFSAASREVFAELARWFANGHEAMTQLALRTPGASDVRCWPHHFDLGFLAVLETTADGSLAKSIGAGLSPGDDAYAEPYWYVSPWPYPEPAALPALGAGGRWHTEGHTSAILDGSALLGDAVPPDPAGQEGRLHAFLDGAFEASRRALAG